MAAGEYVSVSSQTDAEQADLPREKKELAKTPEAGREKQTRIYKTRGLTRYLAEKVAVPLTERDALGRHARDELGTSQTVTAHPIEAAVDPAMTSAVPGRSSTSSRRPSRNIRSVWRAGSTSRT